MPRFSKPVYEISYGDDESVIVTIGQGDERISREEKFLQFVRDQGLTHDAYAVRVLRPQEYKRIGGVVNNSLVKRITERVSLMVSNQEGFLEIAHEALNGPNADSEGALANG